MGEHTPTPWTFSDGFILAGDEALPVIGVQVPMVVGPKRLQAVENSKFIVEAVNSYDRNRATIDALVGALEKCKRELNFVRTGTTDGIPNAIIACIPEVIEMADSALQLARGEKGDVSLPASKEGV